MNIFGGRPGFAAGITAIIAILAAFAFELNIIVTMFALSIFVFVICIVLCACRYITPYRLLTFCVILAIFLTALIRGTLLYYSEIPEASRYEGDKRYLQATVTERRSGTDYFTSYTVRIHAVDGEECDYKALLNCNYSSDLQKGYEFVLKNAVITGIDDLPSSDAMRLASDDIFLVAETSDPDDYAIISENALSLSDHFSSLNSYLCSKLKTEIGGEEGKLAAAMFLGDKYAISPETTRDFKRSGLSHYLAVSGLHVSIITGVVSLFLSRLRIRKLYRNILLTAFAVSYLFLLGFPVSAVRSVAMLLTVFLAYSMGDNADPVNSLGIAATVIILISPVSVFDVSFILSFSATLGIVSFMPLFNSFLNKIFLHNGKKQNAMIGIVKKIFGSVFGTLMSTSAALSFTLLPVTYIFGEMSVMGFTSNLAAAFLGIPLLASVMFYLFLGGIPFIGEVLSISVRYFAGAFIELASKVSEIRGALVSLTSERVRLIVLIFTLLLIVFLIIKIRKKTPLLLLSVSYPLVLCGIIFSAYSARPKLPEVTFTSISGYDSALVVCNNNAAVIDLSEGALGPLLRAQEIALEAGYTEFDVLVLTHYHNDHIAAVTRFVLQTQIGRVILPYPENEADAWIMLQLAESVKAAGCRVELMPQDSPLMLPGGIEFALPELVRIERSNHPVLYCSLSKGSEIITYIGESSWETDGKFRTELDSLAQKSNVLIFGLQGPVTKTTCSIPLSGAKECVFFSGMPIEDAISASELSDLRDRSLFNVSKWSYTFGE